MMSLCCWKLSGSRIKSELLHKLEVSVFKIMRKKVLASYFIVVVAGHFLYIII